MPRPVGAWGPLAGFKGLRPTAARGPPKGRGQQERRKEEEGKSRKGNEGDEQEEGVGCDVVARVASIDVAVVVAVVVVVVVVVVFGLFGALVVGHVCIQELEGKTRS